MRSVNQFCNKNLKYYFLNKFNFLKNICYFKKIILAFRDNVSNLKIIAAHLIFIELLTNKKGMLTITKKPNLLLKVKIGTPIGCKIILSKKIMFKFLQKYLVSLYFFKKNPKFSAKNHKSKFFISILSNGLVFFNFKSLYSLFIRLKTLQIVIITTNMGIGG